jgi:hypothetical protein
VSESDLEIHDKLMDAAERLMGGHDLNPWTALDENDQVVKTPCCGTLEWLDPILFTATCGNCFKPIEVAKHAKRLVR